MTESADEKLRKYLTLFYVLERSVLQFLEWVKAPGSPAAMDGKFHAAVVNLGRDDGKNRKKALFPSDLVRLLGSVPCQQGGPNSKWPAWRTSDSESRDLRIALDDVISNSRNPIMHGGWPKSERFEAELDRVFHVLSAIRDYMGPHIDDLLPDREQEERGGGQIFALSREELGKFCAGGWAPNRSTILDVEFIETDFSGHKDHVPADESAPSDLHWPTDGETVHVAPRLVLHSQYADREDKLFAMLKSRLPKGSRVGTARYIPRFVPNDPIGSVLPHWSYNVERVLTPCYWTPGS